MNDRVEVLLATYRGADYIDAMLASLLAQTYDDFHLIVSDDNSPDDTVARIKETAGQFRNPPRITERAQPSGSAMANFASLIEASEGKIVFFADQDDIWEPNKIERGVSALSDRTAAIGEGTPLLWHCDLSGIGGDGARKFGSYWSFKAIDPKAAETLEQGLLNPVVTGCAMAVNRALLDRAGEFPADAIMHDWWLALTASAFGEVLHDPDPLVQYRIHGGNASRPKGAFSGGLKRVRSTRRGLGRRYRQAAAFKERFESELPAPTLRRVERFSSMRNQWPVLRQIRMITGGHLGNGLWRNLVQVLLA